MVVNNEVRVVSESYGRNMSWVGGRGWFRGVSGVNAGQRRCRVRVR